MAPSHGSIRVVVSACLLGRPVRYDGSHKRDPFVAEILGPLVEYLPLCPETGCGLPTPRAPMRLQGDAAAPRLVTLDGSLDLTDRMQGWIRGTLDDLERLRPCGYICKADSPSCGMEGVAVHDGTGVRAAGGGGLFTRAFMGRFPRIPVEDERTLADPARRRRFLERLLGRGRA